MRSLFKKLFITGFFVCFYHGGYIHASDTPSTGLSYSARVNDHEGVFLFPVDKMSKTWSWNRKSTRPNVLEYGWRVQVPLGKDRYEVGVCLFKVSQSVLLSGDFKGLIKAAQVDAWKLYMNKGKEGGKVDKSINDVSAEVVEGGLRVVVHDKVFLAKFLKSHPKSVVFLTASPETLGEDKKQSVQVVYQ
ncbi:MAG: hypothetical protein HY399_03225 [Elusimicrobia bacterium]|nr:hypothetical protein [Elusimicrobiota bacterium]